MNWIDISMTISAEMPVYKNRQEKKPRFLKTASFEENGVYETDVHLNLHTGTHIDFPLHTIPNGFNSDQVDISVLIGSAKVFDLRHVNTQIDVSDLEKLDIEASDFVLFQTKNSLDKDFNPDFVYVNLPAALYLVKKGIRGVGIDALGIERNQPGHPTHDQLLGNGIVILEGLRLAGVEAGNYEMLCVPLKIAGVEALPVRALIQKIDG